MVQPALYGAIRPSDEKKKTQTPVIIMFFFKSCQIFVSDRYAIWFLVRNKQEKQAGIKN